MLLPTFFVSTSWHPDPVQVFGVTLRSPGLTKRTNSQLSRASRVAVRSGFAPLFLPSRFHSSGKSGRTCASFLSRSMSWASLLVFRGDGLPPWQPVQVRPTASLPSLSCSSVSVVPYLCIGSICPWQEMQPSSGGGVAVCWATAGGVGVVVAGFVWVGLDWPGNFVKPSLTANERVVINNAQIKRSTTASDREDMFVRSLIVCSLRL